MNKQRAQELIDNYLKGTCTPEEKILVEKWYNHQIDSAQPLSNQADLEIVKQNIFKKLPIRTQTSRLYRLTAAAIILISFAVGAYYYFRENTKPIAHQILVKDVKPGNNKAFLTLNDGKRISLTDAATGNIANQAGVTVTKTADGQLVYSIEENNNEKISSLSYNTISTPNGSQYQVRLPDGSNVWLNAKSSLKYPTSFSAHTERIVELQGEAYFEVAHNKKKPFIVRKTSHLTNGIAQEIEVLGTRFNVTSYEDDNIIKTTLLEGSIRLKSSGTNVILKPNQQARLKKEGLKIITVNAEDAIAWKSGYFIFEDESIGSIMRKIARWYDVDIDYQHSNKDQVFSGTISKFPNVYQVLEKLELTGGVHFKIEGRRIIVR